jgi:hypothetical protein
VAEVLVMCKRPKCECCHVMINSGWWGVPGRGCVPLLELLVHWLGSTPWWWWVSTLLPVMMVYEAEGEKWSLAMEIVMEYMLANS